MSALKVLALWWLPVILLLLLPLETSWAAGTPAGTVISNFATLHYKDANGNDLPWIQSNTVTTVVTQVAGVDVSPATSSKTVMAGSSVVYDVIITNMGNGSDTFTLTASIPVPDTWTSVLYNDPNGNGTLDAGEDIPANVISLTTLAADGTKHVFLKITAPVGAANGASKTATVTATSQFNTGVSDSGTYTATVETAVLSALKSASPTTPKPGEVVTYTITGSNAGSSTAYSVKISDLLPTGVTYVPGSLKFSMNPASTYEAAAGLTDASDGDMADFGITAANTATFNWGDTTAGTGGRIFFRVVVNEGVDAGTQIDNVALIHYKTTPAGGTLTFNSNTAEIIVATKAIITLSHTALAHTGDSGDTLKYVYSLTNSGNASDIFNGITSSTQGFTSITWLDANNDGIAGNDGDYILTDTNGDGKIDTGVVLPGTVLHILKLVIVTPGTPDGSVDVTTTTISSVNDPTVTATVTLTTTANTPVITMTKAVSPTGNQPPGTVLTYTITINNTGHGIAKSLLIADIVPTHTTYQAGTITVNGSLKTDASDGDSGSMQSGSIVVDIPTMGPGGAATISFQVKID